MKRLLAPLLLTFAFSCAILTPSADLRAAEEWFDFAPPADEFSDEALLDLREFNRGRAGSEGWVVARGDDLVCSESGRVLRFAAVNGPVPWSGTWGSPEERAYLAKRLGKLGVNLIRLGPVRGAHKITDENLDGLQELVARCAEEGVYTMLGFFFPLEVRVPGIEGWGDKSVQSLAFFHPKVKAAYARWLEKMMTAPNPHTGRPLAQDPALALIILMNEDNLFFHTFRPSNWSDEVRAVLERQFAGWLAERYGSPEKALDAWGKGARMKEDRPDEGRVYVYDAYRFMDADWARDQRNPERAADTLRFLVHLQRGFFAEMKQKLRSWGYGGCTIATNWKTTNPRQLDALEKYANMSADVMDRHAYFGALRKAGGAGWKVNEGDVYVSRSQLTMPDSLMFGVQYAGYPQMLSEHFYPAPNRFRAEMVWLGAHYGAMTGHDGFAINEFHTADWPRVPQKRFDAYTPVNVGQYPAASLVYRLGLIEEAEPVYSVTRTPKQLFQMVGTPVWDDMNLDDMRAPEAADAPGAGRKALDPRAWLVGPVRVDIADRPAPTRVADISQYLDDAAGVARSRTGQLRWDWQQGVATADAPRAQSACGFLGAAGPRDLSDVRIQMDNEYGEVWLVSMDGRPLATSGRMLLQVMTEQRIGGTVLEEATLTRDGESLPAVRIAKKGRGPMQVRRVRARVRLNRPDAAELEVIALDHNGYRRGEVEVQDGRIELLPDCLYYVIRQE